MIVATQLLFRHLASSAMRKQGGTTWRETMWPLPALTIYHSRLEGSRTIWVTSLSPRPYINHLRLDFLCKPRLRTTPAMGSFPSCWGSSMVCNYLRGQQDCATRPLSWPFSWSTRPLPISSRSGRTLLTGVTCFWLSRTSMKSNPQSRPTATRRRSWPLWQASIV